jgi:nicotinamidase-related amidase
MAKALLILDAQNICPVGRATEPGPNTEPALAIGHGDYPALSGKEVSVPLLSLAHAIVRHRGTVVAARPPDRDVAALCVRGTDGAELNPRLRLPDQAVIVTARDGGSRLLDLRDGRGRTLRDRLSRRPDEVLVGGLTTSAELIEAVDELHGAGVPVAILADAIFALDAGPGEKPSMTEFAYRGARVVSTGQAIMELYGWRDEYPAPTAAAREPFPPGRDTWARDEKPAGWKRMIARVTRDRGEASHRGER